MPGWKNGSRISKSFQSGHEGSGVVISMTGYGRGQSGDSSARWLVEISSVNRRQLELVVQLPREYSVLEARVREVAAKSAARGRLAIAATFQNENEAGSASISLETARRVKEELETLRGELGIGSEVTLDHLLRHPALFASTAEGPDFENAWTLLLPALDAALEALREMKEAEGRNLLQEFEQMTSELRESVAAIRKLAPEVPVKYREALLARLSQSGAPMPSDESRLMEELALFAERCDITEELARLESHLEQFTETMRKEGPIGRAMEFLCQEMFRELHTTGSKANDASISKLVVQSKTVLDKIREQLANIE